ncbi:hypothetical protein V1503_24700 [Bacillus sp. SCS-151]|uniref:hypothetical protein n=1 Tax=Nanhaiella sioensis TaxID=3115293 RepID=UPI003978D865
MLYLIGYLRKNNMYVYIELDTGSEKLSDIKVKVKRYKEWARIRANEHHIVIFAALDNSFLTRYPYGDKIKKVGNMKQTLLGMVGNEVDNLDLYVVPLRHSWDVITQIFKGDYP